jgi:DNA gyrase/topoisomerase IV subunit A
VLNRIHFGCVQHRHRDVRCSRSSVSGYTQEVFSGAVTEDDRKRAEQRLKLLEDVLRTTERPVELIQTLWDVRSRLAAVEALSAMGADPPSAEYILDMRLESLLPFRRELLHEDAESIRQLLRTEEGK